MNLRSVLLAVVAGSLLVLLSGASHGGLDGPTSGQAPDEPAQAQEILGQVEETFLDYLDAVGAVGYLESGGAARYEDRDLAAWTAVRDEQRRLLQAKLAILEDRLPIVRAESMNVANATEAVAAMRRTLAALESDDTTSGKREYLCKDA